MELFQSSLYQIGLTTCCLFCLLAALIEFLRQKRLNTKATLIYIEILVGAIFYSITDVLLFLKEISIISYGIFYAKLLAFFNCILAIGLIYLITSYNYLAGREKYIKRNRRVTALVFWPALLSDLIIVYLTLTNKLTVQVENEIGLSTAAFYVIVLDYMAYILINIAFSFKNKFRASFSLLAAIEGIITVACGFTIGIMPITFFTTMNILVFFNKIHAPAEKLISYLDCFNRVAFNEYIKDLETFNKEFYIITLDMLDLKTLTTKHGNKATNAILSHMLSMCPEDSRTTTTFRYNNDIFAIITTKKAEYIDLVNYWSNNLIQTISIAGNKIKLPLMVTHFASDDSIKYKDIGAFVASYLDFEKGNNKSRVACINDRYTLLQREEKITKAVTSAINDNSFEIYLQPIINIKNNKFEKAEVLARLIDKELGYIPASEFIDIAEKKGLIADITKQIIVKSVQAMSEYDFKSLGVSNININISSLEINDISMLEFINAIIAKFDISPSNITIELTETTDSESYEILHSISKAFKEHGYNLALDDYGTGYSNIDRILTIPFDVIKIDKSMIDLVTPKKEALLIGTINTLHICGYKTLVEGVESEEIAAKLKENNVDYIQGFLYARPMPINDYVDFLKANNI